MTIISTSYECQEFQASNEMFKLRVRQWPRNDENDLTTHLPRLAKAVRKLLYATNELKELADKTRGSEEINAVMENFSDGLNNLCPLISGCLGALACTYHRLHGRAAPEWDEIEKMWPQISRNAWEGVFNVASKRIRYNDFVNPSDLLELENVVNNAISAEKALHDLVSEGIYTKEEYAKSSRTLVDPNKQYHWDADDEEG